MGPPGRRPDGQPRNTVLGGAFKLLIFFGATCLLHVIEKVMEATEMDPDQDSKNI